MLPMFHYTSRKLPQLKVYGEAILTLQIVNLQNSTYKTILTVIFGSLHDQDNLLF